MCLNLALLKNLHSRKFCFGHFGPFRAAGQRNYSGILFKPVIVPKNSVAKCIKTHKYFQILFKASKINDFEILQRSLSTSLRLNQKKRNSDNEDKDKLNRKDFLLGLTAIIVFVALYMYSQTKVQTDVNISWEELKYEMLAKGEVKRIYVDSENHVVYVELQDGAIFKQKKAMKRFYRMMMPEISKFEEKLKAAEEELGISAQDSVPIKYIHTDILDIWILVLLALLLFLLSRGSFKVDMKVIKPELFGFTKAKFTLVDPLTGKGKGVKFSDVAGLKEAKTEIMDFVDYLKRPEVYRNLGAKVPKGALLLGPPGCGKTLLAKAVATEASVPFLSMNGSEFIEIIGGLGAARVRDLFKEAKKRIPCIIYIDEIDAIGKKRETNMAVGEVEQTLNQLLVEMDGVLSNQGVVLLASTNRADVLDAALLRPGRFDRKILIDLPTMKEREEIFKQHLKGIRLEHSPETYSKRMASLTPGFSGADIANVCNEAALHAARTQKDVVQGGDLEYAVERVVGGTEKRSSALSPEEKKLLAYYEAGRALIGWLSKYGEALLKITIVSRTDSPAGWTHFSPIDKHLYSEDDLKGKMCMGLGGRVALSLLFNRITTAGEKDLKKVTKLAYAQVRVFGMNTNVGLMSFEIGDKENSLKKPYSKALASIFDQEVRALISQVHKEAEGIILEHKDKLIKLAEELLLKETLNYEDVVKLIGPPLFKGKKLVEPLEFELSLDQAAGGGESEPSTEPKNM